MSFSKLYNIFKNISFKIQIIFWPKLSIMQTKNRPISFAIFYFLGVITWRPLLRDLTKFLII
ncbi:hypothetical protein RhiirA1_486472 [Rhizophagus irregularis]|uniref:Uncharacterized protein n=1 Tax=Rhizophagus irregularis TaxID=588596 RepID=A0A2N0QH85_9GLOM|nr:hypothetical protein RhiirA1_486472 [Rhizophagus irregularis]